MDMAVAPVALTQSCLDSFDDVYTLPDGLPAYDATRRGDVIRCSIDRHISAADLNAQATAMGYLGPTLPSGASIFRIAYRTERIAPSGGTAPGGTSSAYLLVPDQPHGAGALVVYVHPSIGIGPPCAASRQSLLDPSNSYDPVRVPLLGLAGYGWTVVAPDLAGFGYGDAPGWSVAEDEAHSVLDATRAASKILPADIQPSNVVLVGHSQGGHSVLAAHSFAASYGLSGNLIGVAALAPLWISGLAWGAALSPIVGFDTTKNNYFIEYQMDFFYSHGELFDGAGGGLSMFQPAKQAQVQSLIQGQCLDDFAMQLPSLGKTPSDFFDPTFVDTLSMCGIGLSDCTDPLAARWKTRMLADRPPIAANGPPILLWYGGNDSTISPGFAQCELDKLGLDLANSPGATTTITTCLEPGAEHIQVPGRDIQHVNAWIGARATGDPEPTCDAPPTGDAGVPCTTPPANL